ncbi:uncharacterized protein [Battus philenor]|uniref:uncharacterized protein n=1 Tax=Battus philenor TaxID=42288 RepID=UPI0035D08F8D
MGVFKWLRRERVTVTTREVNSDTSSEQPPNTTKIGTIRTEEYKRDLAEFQARRSAGSKDLQTSPVKRKCGRHSLPVSCTDCTGDPDTTFNYEKKSAAKYKKSQKFNGSPNSNNTPPKIQFLFQNQVFMPGNMFSASFSESAKPRRNSRVYRSPDKDFLVQRHIDFKEEEQLISPPLFFKNNSLSFDVNNFLYTSRNDDVDGQVEVDGKSSSHNLPGDSNKDDSCKDKMQEVMSELRSFDRWADEQLQVHSGNTTKSDDNKSDASAYGLAVTSSSDLSVTLDKSRAWNPGKWGLVPVQIKKLEGVTIEHVKKKRNTEINILRKYRHPNIILLMGLYPDVHNNVNIICERCMDSLYVLLHVQGRIISAQTSVQYALDIANALVFLRMQGYLHTQLSSASVVVTSQGTAKLADVAPCVRLARRKPKDKLFDDYSPEPQYINIQDSRTANPAESEPLLAQSASEAYLAANSVTREYGPYRNCAHYRWLAPELFEPDAKGHVYPCSKSDVYSLCLLLWECCNASMPWKALSYEKLKEVYLTWKTGIRLPQDGTYPGALLGALKEGLQLQREHRIDLNALQATLVNVKRDLDEMEYIIIPTRLSKVKSDFSSQGWDTTSPTDSDTPISKNIQHKVVVHKLDTSTDSSDKAPSRSIGSPLYETIRNSQPENFMVPDRFFKSDDDANAEGFPPHLKYKHLPENDFSSACSTPITKLHARIKELGTPVLHRSDSTEYCSILSPDARGLSLAFNDDSTKDKSERSTTKLSRSFTPQSYKPLHIKVPEFKLDSLKSIVKENSIGERSSYNFDIKNYSLPTTPIARSNKLRKNAWLSGDIAARELTIDKVELQDKTSIKEDNEKQPVSYKTSANTSTGNDADVESESSKQSDPQLAPQQSQQPDCASAESSEESEDTARNTYTGLKRIEHPHDFATCPDANEVGSDWGSMKTNSTNQKQNIEEDVLANVNVKPLVAIHERWIYEASKKTGRSMSLPEYNRNLCTAVKPASHCVDTLQKSLPQLRVQSAVQSYSQPASPGSSGNGHQCDYFCQTRDIVAKSVNFAFDSEDGQTWKKDSSKGSSTTFDVQKEPKVDQSTSTRDIDVFLRELIQKEVQHLLHEISDKSSTTSARNDDIVDKVLSNILENLKTSDDHEPAKKESIKSFSRVKINTSNKPLLQITFSKSGENSLQVLDQCVNVTICDGNSGKDKVQVEGDTLTAEDIHVNSLKRCQAFNAIQEARSTEDLYIDDDLSTQMQENFGGKVKLIPLHGSLHEILCEKEDDCCLIKVKQENGCDTIYFRCDNSDTESRDAIDGARDGPQDTVVFKRSISLIEERIQRVVPKEKRPITVRKRTDIKKRPKSEIFFPRINKESRVLSNSSPNLNMKDSKNEEVEVNIENVMCYQDSSSDECLKCQENEEFETLEREIEEEFTNRSSLNYNHSLQKISEENLSVLNEESDKN